MLVIIPLHSRSDRTNTSRHSQVVQRLGLLSNRVLRVDFRPLQVALLDCLLAFRFLLLLSFLTLARIEFQLLNGEL